MLISLPSQSQGFDSSPALTLQPFTTRLHLFIWVLEIKALHQASHLPSPREKDLDLVMEEGMMGIRYEIRDGNRQAAIDSTTHL